MENGTGLEYASMYESEVNNTTESIISVPSDIQKCFAQGLDQVIERTTLPWGEHCTECVWPTCYSTCDRYSPRQDGACRQFVDGMVRIDHKEGLSPYLLKLRFKGWAKLWSVGNLRLFPLSKAIRRERLNIAVGAISRSIPLPMLIKPRFLKKVNYLRRRAAEGARVSKDTPDCFMIECYNPNSRVLSLTFSVRSSACPTGAFQSRITLQPGYTREKIAFSEISRFVNMKKAFQLEIVPNDCTDSVLYFGLLDFVKEKKQFIEITTATVPSNKWKCIVWDLDNTLWNGILIEDGIDKIGIRQGVVDVIRELDQRGILHSIASKNNPDDALRVLRSCNLAEYFLYPQIGWQPKSVGIAQIAKMLNIGIDAVAFVDDQPFERGEVKAALPEVSVLDAADYLKLLQQPECDVPVTMESRNRRKMYLEQEYRDVAQKSFSGDYLTFLRECRLEIEMSALNDSNLRRVYELAQRTNQMNFSGNRYPESELTEIMASPTAETYVVECRDRFGEYGIVGFAVVDIKEPRLLDLMFSCRIQAKRVEHAVLGFLLRQFVGGCKKNFYANYRRTSKNAQSGKVFEEIGFEVASESGEVLSLIFKVGREIPDDGIIMIRRHTVSSRAGSAQ